MKLSYEVLRSVDFLSGVDADGIACLLRAGRIANFPRGHLFWRAGAHPEHVLFPVTGEAKAVTLLPDGRELIDRLIGAGECAGVFGALDGLPEPHFVEAVRDGTFLLVSRRSFLWFLRREPNARAAVLREVGRVYRRSLRERSDAVFLEATERLARYLVENACVRRGDGARVLVHDTRSEMAQRLGMVREVVSRVLGRLESQGLIARMPDGTTFVVNWDGLRDAACPDPLQRDDDVADTDVHAHTRRFFLPLLDPRSRAEFAATVGACRAQLGDLAICRAVGCPLALGEEDGARDEHSVNGRAPAFTHDAAAH